MTHPKLQKLSPYLLLAYHTPWGSVLNTEQKIRENRQQCHVHWCHVYSNGTNGWYIIYPTFSLFEHEGKVQETKAWIHALHCNLLEWHIPERAHGSSWCFCVHLSRVGGWRWSPSTLESSPPNLDPARTTQVAQPKRFILKFQIKTQR